MEAVFRFLMLRPAEETTVDERAIVVTPSTRLAGDAGQDPLSPPQLRARLSLRSPGPLWTSDPVVMKLRKVSGKLYQDPAPSGADFKQQVADAVGRSPADLSDDPDFHSARAQIGDGLIVGKVLGYRAEPMLEELWRLVHVLELIDRSARGTLDLASPAEIAGLRDRTVVVQGLPDRPQRTPAIPRDPASPPVAETSHVESLRTAITELMSLPSAALTEDLPPAGTMPSSGAPSTPATPPSPGAVDPETTISLAPGSVAGTSLAGGTGVGDTGVGSTGVGGMAGGSGVGGAAGTGGMAGATTAVPSNAQASGPRLTLSPTAVRRLSPQTLSLVRENGLDPGELPLPEAVERLSAQLRSATERQLQEAPVAQYVQVGNRLRPFAEAASASSGQVTQPMSGGAVVNSGLLPATHGSLAPVGVGDLLVVKQQLKRYDAVDLSYVENVLQGETRSREHRRAHTTETTVTIEFEESKQEERDQQSTERYELQNEASSVLKEEADLKAGVHVTQYGPMVEFKANVDIGLHASREQSSKVATKYSKEVTAKASSKLSQRTSEKRTVKTTDLYEELNEHGFVNSGNDPVIGQYQFLNKVYEAQVYNYGKRVLFDFMIPEPAAYLTSLAATGGPSPDLIKPDPFTLTPGQIDENNYMFYVQKYAVPGVEPAPKPFITVAPQPFEGAKEGEDKPDPTKTVLSAIPDGFVAIQAYVSATITYWTKGSPTNAIVAVQVGGTSVLWFNASSKTTAKSNLNNEIDSIPISVHGGGPTLHAFTVNVEIACKRTDRALDAWRLKTHSAIVQAYQQQLREYQEKLAAFQVQTMAQAHGTNPAQNRILEKAELRRQAIEILTEQYFDAFGSLFPDAYNVPQIDFPNAAAQGSYARFFEQAFEWEHMMYFLYPYYWAAKQRWASLARSGDNDPLFLDFLKSGFARVVLAVRPGFETAVAHFLETGEIWNGGDLPPITSSMYLNIVEEIRAATAAQGQEVPQGDPWEVVLPTTLIALRRQATLPSWVKQNDGTWVAQ